ncbi:MAG: site-specific tyrosine recombinase/integron integrase [Bacilli bacterium]
MNKYLKDFLLFLEIEKGYSNNTIESYKIDIEEFIKFYKDNFLNLEYENINKYLIFLYQKNLSKNTISRKLSACRTFYKYLVSQKILKDNVFDLVDGPKKSKTLPNFLYKNEMNQITDNYYKLNSKEKLIIECIYSTGIRVSELVNAKYSDIDKNSRTIKILGKGNKERIVIFGDYLYELLDANEKQNYLITNKNGKQITTHGIRYILKNISNKIGLKKHLTPHMFRHTFATTMLDNGADLKTVSELLGHENLKTTGIYTHVSNDRLKQVYLKTHPRELQYNKKNDIMK